EHAVVDVGREQIAGRRGQLQPDQRGEDAAEEKRERHDDQVQDPDPLVVIRQQPRRDAVLVIEIGGRLFVDDGFHMSPYCADATPFPPACSDLMYSMSAATPSSLMSPWKVGMMCSYPFTVLACDIRIDSRK